MSETITPMEEACEAIKARFGGYDKAFPYTEGNILKCVFICKNARTILFFDGISNCCPIKFEMILGYDIAMDTHYIKKKRTTRDTPILGNAIAGAILGGFLFTSETTTKTESIPVRTYGLTFRLQNAPCKEATKWLGNDPSVAEDLKDYLDEIFG